MRISEKELKLAVFMAKPLEVLNLSTTCYGPLRRWGGINTVGDLCEAVMSGEVKEVRHIGDKKLIEINHALNNFLAEMGYEVSDDTN